MATTLSKGYILPETGDTGDIWFPALEDNITLSNSHDHDGTDGERIQPFNLNRSLVVVTSASWTSEGEGLFSKTVTLPTGYSMDASATGTAFIRFFLNGGTNDKMEIMPKHQRLSTTTFKLIMPSSSQAVDVVVS